MQSSWLFTPRNIFLLKSFEQQQENCKNNWWTNLLYINNYYKIESMCIGHSWYLSADFQNAIMGVIVLMLCWKYPKQKAIILFPCIAIAASISGVLTYINKMEGIHFTPPE